MGHFLKRFALWLGSITLVLLMTVGISHTAQLYLGWSPEHTVEFALKLAVGAMTFVSWLLPSPFHRKHLSVKDFIRYSEHTGNKVVISVNGSKI